jgi:hypothetical protein
MSSDPVDRLAMTQLMAGEPFVPTAHDAATGWQDDPLPIFDREPGAGNVTPGDRAGRVTVIGYAGKGKRWVVRCCCGAFGILDVAVLINPKPSKLPMCERCRTIEAMRNEANKLMPVQNKHRGGLHRG